MGGRRAGMLLLALLAPWPLAAKELPGANPIPVLLRRLGEDATRLEACRALEALEDRVSEARALLLQTLRGHDTRRRIIAAYGLGCLGKEGAPAVPDLIAILSSATPELRAAACEALSMIANGRGARGAVLPALAELTRLLGDPDALVRESAANALAALRPAAGPPLLAALRRASKDRSETVRANALSALLKIGRPSPALVRELARELGAKTTRTRMVAASALGEAGAAARPVLADLARVVRADADLDVRRSALHAIGQIGQPSPAVLTAVRNALGDRHLRAAALSALGACAPTLAAAELEKAIADPDPAVRAEAIRQLPERMAVRLLPRLLRAARDPAAEVRIAAINALRTSGKELVVVPALRTALRDGDVEVRDAALIACRLLRADAALPEMIALLGQRENAVLAASTLSSFGPRAARALPVLYGWLRSVDPEYRSSAPLPIAAIEVRRQKACAALKPLRDDPVERVRTAVARATKKLACKE